MGVTQSVFASMCGSNRTDSGVYAPTEYPVFGASLIEVERSDEHEFVPKIVVDCIEYIETGNYIENVGIYRVSGTQSKINDLKYNVMLTERNMATTIWFSH